MQPTTLDVSWEDWDDTWSHVTGITGSTLNGHRLVTVSFANGQQEEFYGPGRLELTYRGSSAGRQPKLVVPTRTWVVTYRSGKEKLACEVEATDESSALARAVTEHKIRFDLVLGVEPKETT